jgi:hypothetical protein
MKRVVPLVLLGLVAGCGKNPPAPVAATSPSAEAADESSSLADLPFVGKVWISTTPGSALGSMLIFLPDRTLVIDSCFETYRLVEWGMAGGNIRWREDTIPIEAAVDMPRPNQLVLKIPGRDRAQSYITASVPYTCPSMR